MYVPIYKLMKMLTAENVPGSGSTCNGARSGAKVVVDTC